MDPRARRSRESLTAAVLDFAANGRLDDVSVSELALAAGVTRDTFYRHASSVTELLSVALTEKLEEFGEAYANGEPSVEELAPYLQSAEKGLLEHMVAHADIYRTALSGHTSAPIRRAISGYLQAQIELGLHARPELAPLPPEELDDLSIGMIAAYAAAGTIASIEVWLVAGDLTDIDEAARIIAASAPQWWSEASGRFN